MLGNEAQLIVWIRFINPNRMMSQCSQIEESYKGCTWLLQKEQSYKECT